MKKNKLSKNTIELDNAELSLIIEALKVMRDKTEEERFYRTMHPQEFYNIYLVRYGRLIDKLDVRVPKAVFLKMPKF